MSKDKEYIKEFSSHMFWDVDISKLDVKRDFEYIIERICVYGLEKDEILMYKLYPIRKIKKVVMNMDFIPSNSLNYISYVLGIKKEKFKCYGKKPLHLIC